ncbi:hypothetical protein V1478_005931 [Vespula squamosa]|uniref:Uncharacterized protein n=1 Tax=Vespula squamosa TaxID=30214 RepID=A0ABD2BA71_VESSQ
MKPDGISFFSVNISRSPPIFPLSFKDLRTESSAGAFYDKHRHEKNERKKEEKEEEEEEQKEEDEEEEEEEEEGEGEGEERSVVRGASRRPKRFVLDPTSC